MSIHDPFLFGSGETACLLIHGFTGSPSETRDLGRYLADQGFTVLGIRLAGHGGSPEELAAVRWSDWRRSVEGGLHYLRRRHQRVSMVGFSLGGALALQIAAEQPVERLISLAAPLALQGDWRVGLLAVVRHVMPWFYPFQQADFSDPALRSELLPKLPPNTNLDDPAVQAEVRKTAKISVGAIDECRLALAATRNILPQVGVPTLVMHGRDDVVANPEAASEIHARIGSAEKDLHYWERTGHQLLMSGPHREAIFARCAAWLRA